MDELVDRSMNGCMGKTTSQKAVRNENIVQIRATTLSLDCEHLTCRDNVRVIPVFQCLAQA